MVDCIERFSLMQEGQLGRPERFFPLFSSVNSLAGVGPKATVGFKNLGVTRVRDLLFFLPLGGIKRLKEKDLESKYLPSTITIEITVKSYRQTKRSNPIRVLVTSSKFKLELVFFHARLDWIKSVLPIDEKRVISGKVEVFSTGLQMVHPDYIVKSSDINLIPDFEPIYSLSKGITQKFMIKTIAQALDKNIPFQEWIHKSILQKFRWPDFSSALSMVHNPKHIREIRPNSLARERLAFDELFAQQISLALARMHFRRTRGVSIVGSGFLIKKLREKLAFTLTSAQEEAISEINGDLGSKLRMNRLLQGDVGSGKTIVALISMLTVVEFGGQAALLAPTEILAKQHYEAITTITNELNISVTLLTGRDKGKLRGSKLAEIRSGSAQIIIGTHALFQESVGYQNLVFAVIDEQHRFGVQQRMNLVKKGINVDVLVMTATPIPRSLSLTYYGDMDISILYEKPENRKPVKTAVMSESKIEGIFDRLEISLNDGRRVYWVCPLIEDSEVLRLTSAELRRRSLKERFPQQNIGLIHGQMSSEDKDATMHKFSTGEINLLVSTTVIEVGVDVPSASIMIVEAAERFGLAQLHQLRGRVGRGTEQSSCILIYSGKLAKTSKARLEILRDTEDGFEISEADLRIRGAGDVLGLQQSGLPKFLIADLATQNHLLEIARDDSRKLLKSDPRLITTRGAAVRDLLYLMDMQGSFAFIQVG
ncbi:MAG: ATP-dependent DNA helicase RecG [Paracoccaceae bacterium]|nr:ATP-dependent DNA helicase RecG [Paracoccaceae bacterium]